MRLGMISQSLIATVAKVVVIGGLMAGAAGGIYAVASTRGDDSSKQSIVAATTTPTALAGSATTTDLATTTATATQPGLTDTGYKAPDGSALYKECVGNNPVTGAKFPLPPDYPTPSASPAFAPTSSTTAPAVARPPDSDLPVFDLSTLRPTDSSQWSRQSTPCVGGLSFGVPPSWSVSHNLVVGGYQQAASAMFVSTDGSVKVDLTYDYSPLDLLAHTKGANYSGNGSYSLERNVDVTVSGATGVLNVSSDIVGSRDRYVTVNYLINPRPDWFLSIAAFVKKPFSEQQFADLLGFVSSIRFQQ